MVRYGYALKSVKSCFRKHLLSNAVLLRSFPDQYVKQMSRLYSFPHLGREAQALLIESSMEKVPSIVAGTVFNAALAGYIFWSPRWAPFILGWMLVTMGVSALRFRHWDNRRTSPLPATDPVKEEWILCLFAFAGGSLWGSMMVASGFGSNAVQFALLAMLGGGVLTIAIVTYGSLFRAAFAFILPLAAGGMASWVIWTGHMAVPAIVMITMFTLLLLNTVRDNEKMFIQKMESEMALRESAETVQMLLQDFESQSADWLWLVDDSGLITSPSVRFAAASRRSIGQLEATRFLDLFDASPEKDILKVHLGIGSPFRSLTVPLRIDGNRHWWALSARPLDNGGLRGVASDATAQKLLETRPKKAAA